MSYEPDSYGPEPSAAAGRANAPGIFLIVTGILNLLVALGCGGFAVMFAAMPSQMLEQAMEQQSPEQRRQMEEQGIGPQQLRNIYVYGGGIPGVLGLLTAPITLFGGIQMCRLRGYGLAVFGAVLALFSGCCVVGQAAGIWALVVLMDPDVKAAFR
jgi:hypothetical protein